MEEGGGNEGKKQEGETKMKDEKKKARKAEGTSQPKGNGKQKQRQAHKDGFGIDEKGQIQPWRICDLLPGCCRRALLFARAAGDRRMTGREWLAEALRTEINGWRGPFKTQDMELHVPQPKRRVNGVLNLVSASGEVRDPAKVGGPCMASIQLKHDARFSHHLSSTGNTEYGVVL